jgi:drug/metabolite transporter (DMT)-like permease
MKARPRSYWIGFALTALGAVILSPDATLFKLIQSDLWTTVFWRALLLSMAVWAWLILTRRHDLTSEVKRLGWALPAGALCWAISNLGFIFALKHTTVADTLAIIATAPIFAAIFGSLVGERIAIRTWLAALTIALGIAIIFEASFEAKTMMGALAALATAISVALFFVIGRLKRDQDLTPALGLSAGLTALFAIFMADTLMPVTADWPNLVFVGLFLLPVSLILITLGPRRLPAAEVGLLMLLETALGPIWAWTVLGEIPSETTILGGTLIVGALGAHGIAAWKSQNKNICQ